MTAVLPAPSLAPHDLRVLSTTRPERLLRMTLGEIRQPGVLSKVHVGEIIACWSVCERADLATLVVAGGVVSYAAEPARAVAERHGLEPCMFVASPESAATRAGYVSQAAVENGVPLAARRGVVAVAAGVFVAIGDVSAPLLQPGA